MLQFYQDEITAAGAGHQLGSLSTVDSGTLKQTAAHSIASVFN